MRLICHSLTVVKRCLKALEDLDDSGARTYDMVRADLLALADKLENAIEADAWANAQAKGGTNHERN